MTRYIETVTCDHFGDALALTCALANARAAFPACVFRYRGKYGDIFQNLDLGEWPEGQEPNDKFFVRYRSHDQEEDKGQAGNLAEGFTLSLSRFMGVKIPEIHHRPVVNLTPEEAAWAKAAIPAGAVLLNTNCQDCCPVKGYPWWGEVLRILARRGYSTVLTGGSEKRDLRLDFGGLPMGTVDLRGKTTLRQLVALCALARCAASPPSSLVHACAAVGCPCVVVTGAREPAKLTAYPGNRHVTSVCTMGGNLYNATRGCLMRHFGEIRKWPQYTCPRPAKWRGRTYTACMLSIPAETVAETIIQTIQENQGANQ